MGFRVVAWHTAVGIVFDSIEVSHVEGFGVGRPGELEHAVNVVFRFAIERHDMTSTHGVYGQRMHLLAVIAQRTEEDADSVQLMAAKFGHQTGPGSLEQPPAMQFFHRGEDLALAVKVLVAELLGIDIFVRIPGDQLCDLGLQPSSLLGIGGRRQSFTAVLQVAKNLLVHLAVSLFFAAG